MLIIMQIVILSPNMLKFFIYGFKYLPQRSHPVCSAPSWCIWELHRYLEKYSDLRYLESTHPFLNCITILIINHSSPVTGTQWYKNQICELLCSFVVQHLAKVSRVKPVCPSRHFWFSPHPFQLPFHLPLGRR